ncbi:MAG: bifunctional riboflavin kinase/FAD synthetase [Bacteroidia bacterium]|nr:bifunctional riboflavin kinase/FAD synthetase [Bacteroidia bacterium]
MKVYNSINEFTGCANPVVTLGTFDGLHYGHKQIINRLKNIAQEINGETVVITFHPHPRFVLFPDDNDLLLLSDQNEKIKLFKEAGTDHLIIHPFTKEFSRLSTIEFVRNLLVNKIGVKQLVIGYDHRLGRNREGSIEQLKELEPLFDFKVIEIPKQEIDNISISSTKIREAIKNGDLLTANNYLGYYYTLSGTVIKGNQLGRKINFPTANIKINDTHKLIPGNGVYVVKVLHKNNQYGGMMNIGYKPTVSGVNLTLEVNIFNFNQEIYSDTITICFVERLREERKFESIDLLKKQLFEDRENAMEILENEV